MADLGEDWPWSCLESRIFLRTATESVTLSLSEFLSVCAAVEHDRVWSLADVVRARRRTERALARDRHRGRAAEWWAALVDGAPGCTYASAERRMTVREVYRRLGVTAVEWTTGGSADESARLGREALAALREAAE